MAKADIHKSGTGLPSFSKQREGYKATEEVEFNIPQLLCVYLSQIVDITDKMGKEKELEVPVLVTSLSQGMEDTTRSEWKNIPTVYLKKSLP
jgi:hypothetical protein